MGAGTIMFFSTYPECKIGQEKFWAWIDKNGMVPDESPTPPIENGPQKTALK